MINTSHVIKVAKINGDLYSICNPPPCLPVYQINKSAKVKEFISFSTHFTIHRFSSFN